MDKDQFCTLPIRSRTCTLLQAESIRSRVRKGRGGMATVPHPQPTIAGLLRAHRRGELQDLRQERLWCIEAVASSVARSSRSTQNSSIRHIFLVTNWLKLTQTAVAMGPYLSSPGRLNIAGVGWIGWRSAIHACTWCFWVLGITWVLWLRWPANLPKRSHKFSKIIAELFMASIFVVSWRLFGSSWIFLATQKHNGAESLHNSPGSESDPDAKRAMFDDLSSNEDLWVGSSWMTIQW